MAAITFSKQKGVTTKGGWPLNLCKVPEQQRLNGTNGSDVTSSLYQIATTYLQTLIPLPVPS